MSSSNPKKNWFSNLFSSLSTPSDIHSGPCSLPVSGSAVKKSMSKLSEITTSDHHCFPFTSTDNLPTRKQTLSKFVSLQRLDSVGSVEPEPNRFSYPLSKGETDSYIMGNILQSSWLQKGLPATFQSDSRLSPNTTNSQTFLGNSLSQVGNYLFSRLQKVSTSVIPAAALHTPASSLVRRETNLPIRNSSSFTEANSLVNFPNDVKRISSCTVTCVNSFAACKKLGSYQSDTMTISANSSDTEISITDQKSKSDANSNIPVLKQENNSISNLQCDEMHNNVKSQRIVCFDKPLCTSNDADIERCGDFVMSSRMRSNSSSFDNVCTECRLSSYSEDCCSEVSSAVSDSEYSATTDDEWSESENDFVDDTDSENGSCPWERLTSVRTPWTCGQNRKQNNGSKENRTTTPRLSIDEEEIVTFEHSPAEQIPRKSRRDLKFHPIDEYQLQNAATRPSCLNSNISFILGCPDENGYDSDNEDNLSWCSDSAYCEFDTSGEPNSISDDASCCPSSQSNGACAASSSNSNDSCRLWDYFTNQHNPLSRITSAITDFCPNSPKKEKEAKKHRFPSGKESTNSQNKAKEKFYKAPSKVRFADNVVVHHMVTWAFAYRQARKGLWDRMALDRDRFRCRIQAVEKEISWCLRPVHRQKMMLHLVK